MSIILTIIMYTYETLFPIITHKPQRHTYCTLLISTKTNFEANNDYFRYYICV